MVAIGQLWYCTNYQTIALSRNNTVIAKEKCAYGSLETVKTPTTFTRNLLLWIILRACAVREEIFHIKERRKISRFWGGFVETSLMPQYFKRGRPVSLTVFKKSLSTVQPAWKSWTECEKLSLKTHADIHMI